MLRHFVLMACACVPVLAAEFNSQASILTPGTLELKSDHYSTSFSDSPTGMPAVALGFGIPYLQTGGLVATAQIGVGYRYKQGSYAVKGENTLRELEPVSLHWIPMSLSTKLTYDFSGINFARPTLTLGLGAQWLRLVGKLPGFTQSFWTPYFFVSPALTVFESRDEEDWFGGFSFGPTYYQSFSTAQKISGLSLDLTLTFLL